MSLERKVSVEWREGLSVEVYRGQGFVFRECVGLSVEVFVVAELCIWMTRLFSVGESDIRSGCRSSCETLYRAPWHF